MTGNSAVPENSLCEKPNTARVFPGFIHGSESSRQYQGTQRACENRVLVAEGTESIIHFLSVFFRFSETAHILTPASWVFAVLEKMQPTPQAVGVVQKIGAPVKAKEPYAERAQRFGAGYGRKKHPDPESEAIR
jgi:hypothetical protein